MTQAVAFHPIWLLAALLVALLGLACPTHRRSRLARL